MKTKGACVLFGCLVLFLLFPLCAEEGQPRVAVIPLNHPAKISADDAAALTMVFETALIQTGAFIVVKQAAVGTILAAQAFSQQDFADQEYAVKIGKLICANQIVTGELSQLGNNFLLNLQLIETESGKALQAEQLKSLSLEGFLDKVTEAAAAFAAKHGQAGQKSLTEVKKAEVYLNVGDKFRSEANYDKAIEQYTKALEQDEFNTGIMLKAIATRIDKILANTLYHSQAVNDGLDVALRDDYEFVKYVSDKELNDTLEQILVLRTVDKAMENNVALLIQEATLYKAAGKMAKAAATLDKALKLAPNNPLVLAESGLLSCFIASNAKKPAAAGVELIRAAITREPENPLFHLYLARSLERAETTPNNESIREYRRAAELALENDFRTKRIRQFAFQSLQRACYDLGGMEGGILTPALDMSPEERLDHLLFLQANNIPFNSRTDVRNPEYFLTNLYLATGKIPEAEQSLRRFIADRGSAWLKNATWLRLAKTILEKSGQDAELLKQVNEELGKIKQ